MKDIGKKVLTIIKNAIVKFFKNLFTKILKKLKEWGNKGITGLSKLLGIEIDGKVSLKVSF